MREITQPIKGFAIKADKPSESTSEAAPPASSPAPVQDPQQLISQPPVASPQKTEMSEHIGRPDVLIGSTYKISKSPASEHALYVTINDIVLDQGTTHERRRPFEIFINSKNMDQFQWIVALTRILSAVFRKGGDVTFLVEEMKAVFDPHGGYFRPGGYVPSLVAEIGSVVERHLKMLGMIESPEMDEHTRALLAEKRAQYDALHRPATSSPSAQTSAQTSSEEPQGAYPPNATMCSKCHQKSVIILDGCATCLNCGDSKCG